MALHILWHNGCAGRIVYLFIWPEIKGKVLEDVDSFPFPNVWQCSAPASKLDLDHLLEKEHMEGSLEFLCHFPHLVVLPGNTRLKVCLLIRGGCRGI